MKKKLFVNSILIIGFSLILSESCEKDITNDPKNSVRDIDGNLYKTVVIGNQTWMAENLKVTRYQNGDLIGTTSPVDKDISNQLTPKYEWAYEGQDTNIVKYGRLYTWYAATDSRNVCPLGWHLPSDNEWQTLEDYLISNGYNYDGTILDNKIAKAIAADTLWAKSTSEGVIGNTDFPLKRNITGFTALPGGNREVNGTFTNFGMHGNWWCSDSYDTYNAWCRVLHYNAVHLQKYKGNSNPVGIKRVGISIRCIKD